MKKCKILLSIGLMVAASASFGTDRDWPVYGGNSAGQRFSTLEQIQPANVAQLAEAWRFETGPGGLQVSPIVRDGMLFGCGPDQSVFALDASSGKSLWRFNAPEAGFQPVRGVSFWQHGDEKRLFASASYYLYALNPDTGKAIASFGDGGRIDLRQNLGRDPNSLAVFMTTPGTVYQDLIITGFRTGDGAPAAPGDIRAFDVRTGQLVWSFKTIPEEAKRGWTIGARETSGGANNWAGMALDEERGIVYVPTGSAASDFYGAKRPGDNLYANSLLALDASNGKLLWYFQAVHHDLWDKDFAAPPTLMTLTHNGKKVDAVAVANKQGYLYVFDRISGKPLFPIDERSVPQSTVPGEHASPTQPIPRLPGPLSRQQMTEPMITRRTAQAQQAVADTFKTLINKGPFTPFSTDAKTLLMPGFDGGAQWGGAAVDPARGILYVNALDVPSLGGLRENRAEANPGEQLYGQYCAVCHGADGKGSPPDFPSLKDVAKRLSRPQVEEIVMQGKGRMPGFPQLKPSQREVLLNELLGDAAVEKNAYASGMPPAMLAEFRRLGGDRSDAYLFTGYEKFTDPDGYPAIEPPWGTMNAIDLNTGQYLWRVPLGEYPELVAAGIGVTGSENYGGPLLTASQLVFIGATIFDRKFRAFDANTGAVLWETQLPYAGVATPITYSIKGRQYVVIATSGSRDRKGPQGSAYIAFALPNAIRH